MDNIQAHNDSWVNEIECLVLNVSFLTDLGLFHGKMGHAIFFAHYGRLVNNVSYEDFAGELLEEIYEEININLPINMECGLCGIGWGIEYLVGQGFMEGCTDEILKDIDELIMERDPRRMHDLSFRKGLGGILYYVMVRLSSLRETDNLPFDSFYLESLREVVLEKDFRKEKSLSFLIDDFILVLEGKKRVKPDLSVLFQVSPPRKSSTDLLSDGLEYGWQMLESGDAGKLYKNYHWHEGKNYYLINEESESANYGIGTYLNQIAETMKESDYSLTIITLRSSKTSSLAIEEKANVRYISIGGTRCKMNSMNWIKYFKRYYRGVVVLLSSIITEKQNNIFHLNNMHMKDLAFVLKENNPASKIVCTVHYMDWALQLLGDRRKLDYILSHPDEKDYKTISVVLEENKRFLKACDLIIAVSRHSFNVLVDICGIPESKIVLIPHGIKDEYQPISIEEKNERRKKHGFLSDDIILICAGRIEPLKGVDLLADAFSSLISEYPHLRLVIAGGGSPDAVQKKVTHHCGRVSFVGFVNKATLYELFSISDVGVLPSLYEELGYVALEMMMMGLPVVVGNHSGLEEIVDCGKYGLVVPFEQDYGKSKENAVALYGVLDRILKDDSLRKDLQKKGRERFVSCFDISYFARFFYQKVISLI